MSSPPSTNSYTLQCFLVCFHNAWQWIGRFWMRTTLFVCVLLVLGPVHAVTQCVEEAELAQGGDTARGFWIDTQAASSLLSSCQSPLSSYRALEPLTHNFCFQSDSPLRSRTFDASWDHLVRWGDTYFTFYHLLRGLSWLHPSQIANVKQVQYFSQTQSVKNITTTMIWQRERQSYTKLGLHDCLPQKFKFKFILGLSALTR